MNFELIVPLILLAFICELVDSSLGMGYGTILTPVLLLMGYEPLEIVPVILLSESITGVTAGVFHHGFGNVNLRPSTRDFRVMTVMLGLSLVGVLMAVVLALNLPSRGIKIYIGMLLVGVGVFILMNRQKQVAFSWRRISALGFLAAFNKGISGGGYGPVVTGGQVLAGVRGRSAVGIASLSEGITSAVGVLAYLVSGAPVSWHLAPSLMLGAILSAPVAAFVVSRLPEKRLTLIIGSITTTLGGYTLVQMLF